MLLRLLTGFFFLVLLVGPVEAIQIGLLDRPDNPLRREGEAETFSHSLETTLGEAVKVRWFTSHRGLLSWLQVHRELDLALLPENLVVEQAQLRPLTAWPSLRGAGTWIWVAGPGFQADDPRRWQESLASLAPEPVSEVALSADILPEEEIAPQSDPPEATFVTAEKTAEIQAEEVPAGIAVAQEPGVLDDPVRGEEAPVITGNEEQEIESGKKDKKRPTGKKGGTSFDELENQPVDIEANQLRFDEATGLYHARGDVLIKAGPVTLRSQAVDVNPETTDVVAEGAVELTAPEGDLRGEVLSLNMDSGLGTLERGAFFIKDRNFHVAGEQIEKLDSNTYHLTRGTFTTCDGDNPDWHFAAKDLEVTLDGYAKGKHAVFYVRDIPLLYTPYLVYPVKRKRESGFLVPSFGYSKNRGTQIFIPYYWAIARNQDATFYLDWLSDLGLGKGVEYRYIFGDDNEGELHYYHINGVKDAADRYAYQWEHDGTLPGDWRLTSDVEYVSSRDYWEDFGDIAEEYNKDKVDSTISVNRNWDMLNLTTQVRYTKDLQKSNDQTLQRLPEVRLEVLRQRYKETPFYYEMASSATYFWRREGLKGERFLARPAVSAVWQPGDIFEIQPEIGYTQRNYWTSSDGPGYEDKGIYDFSTKVSTRVSRVYDLGAGLISKIRHSIEPDVTYSFIPDEDQSHLPSFDSLDRIDSDNRLSYGLTNRLVAKLEAPDAEPIYHQFLYLRLSQDYDIEESRRDLLNPTDERRPFSAIRTELIFKPTRKSLLDLDARYDPNSEARHFTTFNVLGRYRDGAGNGLRLEYRYRRDEVEYAKGQVDLALMKPVYLNYQHRYDFTSNEELEKVLNLEYRSQCWSIFLTYRDRLEDKEYLVSFALTGLGKVAEFGGDLGDGGESN